MKTSVGLNDDYASIDTVGDKPWRVDTSQPSFYYGYEVGKNDEWCFQAKMGKEVLLTLTTSELLEYADDELEEGSDPGKFLIQGMYLFMTKFNKEK